MQESPSSLSERTLSHPGRPSASSGGSDLSNGSYTLKRLASTLSVLPAIGGNPGQVHFPGQNLPSSYEEPTSWKSSPDCEICHEPFTMLSNRPHHCRKCKRTVCANCGCYMKFLDQKREKKYRVCISCETISQNKELFEAYDAVKQALHQQIEVVKTKLEGTDHDCGEVERQYQTLRGELGKQRERFTEGRGKAFLEVEGLSQKIREKRNTVLSLEEYVRKAQVNLVDVNGLIQGGRDELEIREAELNERCVKLRVIERDVEDEEKSLVWKQTVRVGG